MAEKEKKGLIYEACTIEGVEKIDEQLLNLDIENVKAQFQQTYRDALRQQNELVRQTKQAVLEFRDGVDVDEVLESSMSLDQVNAEINKLKDVYADWFGETIDK